MGVKVKEKINGSGVWWVFINHNGRRKSKRVGSEKAAKKVAEMIEARLKLGQAALPGEKVSLPTLEKYFKRFQETYLETAVRRSTKVSYESSFRLYLLPDLGQLRLDEISRDKILDL